MAQEVKATRSELLKAKKQIKLAKSGHSLLKKKRDGLILELFEILKSAKTLRQELAGEYKKGLEKLNIARTLDGDLKVKSNALAIPKISQLNLTKKNVMGIKVIKIDYPVSEHKKLLYASASIGEAAESYHKITAKIIQAAEVETTLRKLLSEIQKTMRRVNALEYVVIPRLAKTKNFIQLRLEEMERETIFGMKRIKAKALAGK